MPDTPTTSIRWRCVEDILEGVSTQPQAEGVKVSPGYPGDEAKGQQLWIEDIDGNLDLPVWCAGRKPRSDTFDINIRVLVTDKRTLTLAYQRVIEICSAVEDYLADHSTLGTDLTLGVMSAKITTSRQKATTLIEGPVGIAEMVVEVTSRLT